MNMEEPPAKRSRRMPCPCNRCKGKERDHRTVFSHLGASNLELVISNTSTVSTESSTHDMHDIMVEASDDDLSSNSSFEHQTTDSPLLKASPCPSNDKVDIYVLKEVGIKLNFGHSQPEIEQHLQNTAELLGDKRIPTTWADTLKHLRKLGYCDPLHHKVCVGDNHSVLLKKAMDKCPVCNRARESCIDYYVLGLNFHDWFITEDRCTRLLTHWNEHSEWLNKPNEDIHQRIELWHGERFRELSYFWDPTVSTLLPEMCPSCNSIIPATTISSGEPLERSAQFRIVCPTCISECHVVPRYMNGDPRNQAIIFHIDGWNPHSTSSKHSIAAITVSSACMSKLDRCANKNARVFSFIPVHQLPRDCPHKYDAFLEPLVKELEDLYINGMEVYFHSPVPGYSEGKSLATLRALPLLLTADSKAHAEVGLTAAGGRKGCRRCEVVGEYVASKNHYYYGNFATRHSHRSTPRSLETNRKYGKDADQAATTTQRKALVRETGVTGESILYRLHDLCGFNPIKDSVIDAMHAVVLNLIRTEIEKHLLHDMGPNKGRRPLDRKTLEGGVLERQDLAAGLACVPWTCELKDGRVPHVTLSEPNGPHKLGFWKSEEFSKFAIVAPYVLHNRIPRDAYRCFVLLTKIHHLVFSKHLRINGWTNDHIELLEHLLWKHAIQYESIYAWISSMHGEC